MECLIAGAMRYLDKQWPWFSWPSPNMDLGNSQTPRCNVGFTTTRMGSQSLSFLREISIEKYSRRHSFGRMVAVRISLEGKPSSSLPDYLSDGDEVASDDSSDSIEPQKSDIEELRSLLADTQRSKLTSKLSEANQHNRHLKRQLQIKDDALVSFKSELAVMEVEIQTLVTLAEEISKLGIPFGSRKIDGKYIQSNLLSRLQDVHGRLKEQIKDVEAVQAKEVPLFWFGMAESVQVMGSFDGWSQGEHLSPEYTGSLIKFSAILMLRPGRYEIKFLVDGEWLLSPELPIVGEGLMKNNLLVVE